MFTITTNLAIWMAAVVDESVHQAHSHSDSNSSTSHTRLALDRECSHFRLTLAPGQPSLGLGALWIGEGMEAKVKVRGLLLLQATALKTQEEEYKEASSHPGQYSFGPTVQVSIPTKGGIYAPGRRGKDEAGERGREAVRLSGGSVESDRSAQPGERRNVIATTIGKFTELLTSGAVLSVLNTISLNACHHPVR